MINTPKRLYVNQPGMTVSTAYTVPALTTTIVKNIHIANNTAAVSTVTIHLVPNGQTATNANKIIACYPVKPNDSISVDLSSVLHSGDTIQVSQGTANAISVYISGVECV
ncbi:hypothetical protein [Paenibacillus chitinolyticus]|uniref:hypothetical protein n=1 Tax=Paenibacillus chitinolyticus TaxID=79263 RepID=UPI0022838301|nr:hypothetical protein [Paenibacillus chitinolyticus]MCY9591440.1 hypothetical protein [Paenibacillus chitinolyticus]